MDKRIVNLRVVAMLLIILAHYLRQYNLTAFLGQVFNIGVYIFICISAFLYSAKDIDNITEYIKKRVSRIIIPYWIFLSIYFFISLSLKIKIIDIKTIIIYFCNLQAFSKRILGTGHLWFLTIIVICYLITILLNRNKEILVDRNKEILVTLVLFQIGCSYINAELGVYIFYISFYIIFYIFSLIKFKNINFIILSCMALIGLMVRIGGKIILDNTIIYENIIVLYSQAILAVYIFIVFTKKEYVLNIKLERIVKFLDSISYEIYLTHYIFIIGSFSVLKATDSIIINILLGILMTIIFSIVIKIIEKFIYKYLS